MLCIFSKSILFKIRNLCSIDDDDSVLIIGGVKSGCCYYNDVERYSSTGQMPCLALYCTVYLIPS